MKKTLPTLPKDEAAHDTRKSYYAHELPDEMVEALRNSDFSHIDPQLDLLMDEDGEG